jgi:hypothetical protein
LEKGFYINNKYAMDNTIEEVDPSFGCTCGGWHLSVQKIRTPIPLVHSKKEDSPSKESMSEAPSAPEAV